MEIILYYNKAESEILDKTKYLDIITIMSGALRAGTSIISPSITISLDEGISNNLDSSLIGIIGPDKKSKVLTDSEGGYALLSVPKNNNVLNSNYVYIREFNRYYYVNNIISLGNNLWQLDLNVDVLMSHMEEIKNLHCIITRNEFRYNELLPDRLLPIMCSNTIESLEIDNSEIPANKLLKAYGSNIQSDRCVLIQVANRKHIEENTPVTDTNSLNKTYILTGQQFAQLVNKIMDSNAFTDFTWLFSNPYDSLVSFKVVPFNLEPFIDESNRETVTKILIGNQDAENGGFVLSGVGDVYLIKENYKLDIPLGKFNYTPYSSTDYAPKFLSYQPYMNMQLFLPLYGFVDIDVNMFNTNGTIEFFVNYVVDIVTGSCVALIKDKMGVVRYMYEFTISLEIPIGYSNYSNIVTQQSLTALKALSALAGIGIGYGSSLTNINTRNSIPANTSRQKTMKMIGQEVARNEMETQVASGLLSTVTNFTVDMIGASQSKVSGGTVSNGFLKGTNYMNFRNDVLKPMILVKKPDIVNLGTRYPLSNIYAHYYGRPIYEEQKLENLRGFTVVGSVHMDGFKTALQAEVDEIYQILTTGIRLPE